VKVYAVEKNPYAVVTLRQEKEETWKDKVDHFHERKKIKIDPIVCGFKVEVISSDMRSWKPAEVSQ